MALSMFYSEKTRKFESQCIVHCWENYYVCD